MSVDSHPRTLPSTPPHPNSVTLPPMNRQPQPIVIKHIPLTRYGINSFQVKDLRQEKVGQSPYFETDRIRALAVYAETGNQHEAARQIGVDPGTVNDWVNDESAPSLIAELRSTVRYNEGWRLARLVSQSLEKVSQAMDDGDPVVLKSGQIIYRRQSLRDLTICMSILMDKWMLISGAISNETMLLGKMTELSQQLQGMGATLAASGPMPIGIGTPIAEAPGENLIG